MDDSDFIRRMKARIEASSGQAIELKLDTGKPDAISVEFSSPIPQVVMGADVLKFSGLARMFMQYVILSLRMGRKVEQDEFFLFMRRN